MCTNFYVGTEAAEIAARALRSPLAGAFAAAGRPARTSGDFRPSDVAPVVAPDRRGGESAFPMRWGFRYPDGSLGVNARLETAAVRPAFREAWRRRRCAVPASWYCERIRVPGRSGRPVPGDKYRIRPRGGGPLWLAGLYRFEDGLPVFTILTAEAAEEIRFVHGRMPLALPGDAVRGWIDPDGSPEEIARRAVRDMVAERVAE